MNQESRIRVLQKRGLGNAYKNFFFIIILFVVVSLPFFTLAVDTNIANYGTNQYTTYLTGESSCAVPPRNFSEFICVATNSILSPLIPILITLALIAFFWGVAKYVVQGANDEKSREQGKQIMLWGIVGLFVMVSVWGLVAIVQNTFNLENAPFNASQVNIP